MSTAKAYTGQDSMELYYLRSPVDEAINSPELFACELLVYVTCFIGFLHAKRNGSQHLLFFWIALLAASIVDPVCLVSEQIRNYYHSHASILMFDRHVAPWQFPLFCCIAYVPGAVVWSLGLGLVSETLLIVFVSSWSFYCFDLFACKWLLYQWHASDPLYQARTQCVPLASSMWVMCYAAAASVLARLLGKLSVKNLFLGISIFLCTHTLPINVLYFPVYYFGLKLEYEVVWGFAVACLVLSIVLHLAGVEQRQPASQGRDLALLQSAVWFGGITAVFLLVDPANVYSYAIHQPIAGNEENCQVMETYLFGLGERKRYLCESDLTFWRLDVNPNTGLMPQPKEEYYVIRGLPMSREFYNDMAGSLAFGLLQQVVILAFAHLFVSVKRTKTKKL